LEAVKKMKDSLKLEQKKCRAQYQEDDTQLKDEVRILGIQEDHFRDKQDFLISRASRRDEDLEAVKMRYSLNLEPENLGVQYQEDVAQLQDQLSNVRTQYISFYASDAFYKQGHIS
jgi:hypothetical protein